MKQSRPKSRIICLLGLVLSISTTAFAGEIDLSSLSAGDEASHNHIYEEKFNEQSHWNECIICKDSFDIESHSLLYTYTNGQDNCMNGNKKLTECTGCNYIIEEDYNPPHTFQGIYLGYDPNNGGAFLYSNCSKCGMYNPSYDGYKYYYDANKTQLIEPANYVFGKYIYDDYGNNYNLTWGVRKTYMGKEFISADYSVNGDVVNVNIQHRVPEDMKQKFTVSELTNSANIYHAFFAKNAVNGYENEQTPNQIPSRSYNPNTGIISFNMSFTMRDKTKDYTTNSVMSYFVEYRIYENGVYVGDIMYHSGAVPIDLVGIDPVISSVS